MGPQGEDPVPYAQHMSTTSHSRSLRRLGALALVPLVMLLSACGLRADITIHTADMAFLMWDSTGTLTESDCNASDLADYTSELPDGATAEYTFTEHNGNPACLITASGLTMGDVTDSGDGLVHTDGKYVFDMPMSDMSSASAYLEEFTYSITFPGKVTEASGNATIDGNTVSWDLTKETENLHAVAEDAGGGTASLLLWVVGGVVLLAAIGAVVAVVIISQKKKSQAAPAPLYGQPGTQAAAGFPVPQPGQPTQAPYGQPAPPTQPLTPASPRQPLPLATVRPPQVSRHPSRASRLSPRSASRLSRASRFLRRSPSPPASPRQPLPLATVRPPSSRSRRRRPRLRPPDPPPTT